MGSSSEGPNRGINAAVGGLIWVRRRNGAWWPGKILGPDELPEGCAPTPRAGTPVKLLGREDASVDWYNLEKSKRVKVFHIEEYNDCIKKVKVSASHPSKRAAKYARREDAILHALELENARLGKDNTYFSAAADAEEHQHVGESPSASHSFEDVDDDLNTSGDTCLDPEISLSHESFDGQGHLGSANGTENESEDDGSEGVKHTKGLEDLGMGVASPLKRKQSPLGDIHEFYKRKNRQCPLTKVEECVKMVSVPFICERLSVMTESNESKKNWSALINSNSDISNGTLSSSPGHASDGSLKLKLKDNETSSMQKVPESGSLRKVIGFPLVAEEKKSAGFSLIASDSLKQTQVVGGAQSSQNNHIEAISLGNEEDNEYGSTRLGTSWWRLKGKRKSRSRKADHNSEAETFVAGTERETLPSPNRNMDPNNLSGPLPSNIGGYIVNSRPITADPLVPPRLLPYRMSRLTVNPKFDDSDYSLIHQNNVSGLYNVNIDVKKGCRPQQHVPYISLISKLTGRPVVGHPLTIGVLRDGTCDYLISKSEFSEDVFALESVRRRKGQPPGKHGSLSKSSKSRRNGLLSKKTRKLSSLTGSRPLRREERKPVMEKLKGPSIACVPLKLVFSRINAALTSSSRAHLNAMSSK